MGENYYPVLGSKLGYDTDLGGYRVNSTSDQRSSSEVHREPMMNWSHENTVGSMTALLEQRNLTLGGR